MIEQKIKLSKSIINTLVNYKQGNLDQNTLNSNLLTNICDLLNQKKDSDINDSFFIPNKQFSNSFLEKIETEKDKSFCLDRLSEIDDDAKTMNFSVVTSLTKNFNELKENNTNNHIFDESIRLTQFDDISMINKDDNDMKNNQSYISLKKGESTSSGHISSLSKEFQNGFYKKCKLANLINI